MKVLINIRKMDIAIAQSLWSTFRLKVKTFYKNQEDEAEQMLNKELLSQIFTRFAADKSINSSK
ncbi:hypothetical protein [Peribacillus loiseleuriae]|nr:hypothetical protein [Peribacillus loiseleuriae]